MVASVIIARSSVQPGVAHHHLVEGDPLLGATDEEVAPQLRHGDHDPGLADQPRVGWTVVHDPARPRHGPLGLEAPLEKKPEVPDLGFGFECELLLALLVLGVGRVLIQDAGTELERRERPVELVPTHELAPRLLDAGLARLQRPLQRGFGSLTLRLLAARQRRHGQ